MVSVVCKLKVSYCRGCSKNLEPRNPMLLPFLTRKEKERKIITVPTGSRLLGHNV